MGKAGSPRTRSAHAGDACGRAGPGLEKPQALPAHGARPGSLAGPGALFLQLARLPRKLRRQLQRRWKRSLAGLALLLALGQAPALAATINVTTTNPNIVAGSGCSLIEAINNANSNSDTSGGDCIAGSGADTIDLAGAVGTHTLTAVNNSTFGATGLPVVSTPITIEGNGSTITRDSGAPAFRIFAINSAGNLTLNETTERAGAWRRGAVLMAKAAACSAATVL